MASLPMTLSSLISSLLALRLSEQRRRKRIFTNTMSEAWIVRNRPTEIQTIYPSLWYVHFTYVNCTVFPVQILIFLHSTISYFCTSAHCTFFPCLCLTFYMLVYHKQVVGVKQVVGSYRCFQWMEKKYSLTTKWIDLFVITISFSI